MGKIQGRKPLKLLSVCDRATDPAKLPSCAHPESRAIPTRGLLARSLRFPFPTNGAGPGARPPARAPPLASDLTEYRTVGRA